MKIYPTIPPLASNEFVAIAHQLDVAELTLPLFSGSRQPVPVYRIVRLEGDGNYTRLFFDNGNSLLLSTTLKRIECRLPQHVFVRTHRKNLINLLYLREIYANSPSCRVVLTNGDVVEVSRRKAIHFHQQIKSFQQALANLASGVA